MQDLTARRRQDFWTALLLIAVSLFFLQQTSEIPFFKADAAGVDAGQWYNSAALVPFCIFGLLLALSIGLLVNAIRQGGLPETVTAGASAWHLVQSWAYHSDVARMVATALIMLAYIFALVPRVDFTIASALVLLALIYGFNATRPRATVIALVTVLLPSLFSLIVFFPRADWGASHLDDYLVLAAFLLLIPIAFVETKKAEGKVGRILKLAPWLAFLFPLFLVMVMAFGFRQNIPTRTGLLFQQIEYHYYVTLKPWLGG